MDNLKLEYKSLLNSIEEVKIHLGKINNLVQKISIRNSNISKDVDESIRILKDLTPSELELFQFEEIVSQFESFELDDN